MAGDIKINQPENDGPAVNSSLIFKVSYEVLVQVNQTEINNRRARIRGASDGGLMRHDAQLGAQMAVEQAAELVSKGDQLQVKTSVSLQSPQIASDVIPGWLREQIRKELIDELSGRK